MCSGIHGNRQVVVQSEAFYQPNEQRAIAARFHVRYINFDFVYVQSLPKIHCRLLFFIYVMAK